MQVVTGVLNTCPAVKACGFGFAGPPGAAAGFLETAGPAEAGRFCTLAGLFCTELRDGELGEAERPLTAGFFWTAGRGADPGEAEAGRFDTAALGGVAGGDAEAGRRMAGGFLPSRSE